MSSSLDELRDALDGVVREPATAIRVDAAAVWAEGRRRRRSNRVGVAAMVVAGVIGGALALSPVLSGLPRAIAPAGGSGSKATEHPARLDYVYWDDEQPSVTGPLAGLVYRSAVDPDGKSGWYTVSPKGHLWHLDASVEAEPSLSPDGSHLAYMQGSFLDATYVIVNQVDGTITRFPQIGTGGFNGRVEDFDDDHRFASQSQSPTFWSPDGAGLLLKLGTTDPDDPLSDVTAAVLSPDGTLVTIPQPDDAEGAFPIGWVDDEHIALAFEDSDPANVRVWIIDVGSGEVVRDFTLEDGVRFTSQWFGSISPDGTELATEAGKGKGFRLYSMRGPTSGDLVTKLPTIAAAPETCGPSWSSSDLYAPTYATPDGNASILTRADGGATIVADPRLDVQCSTWARSALDGPAHVSLGARFFGQQNTWLSWHWREVVSLPLLAVALWLGIGLVRRRTRPARSIRQGTPRTQ